MLRLRHLRHPFRAARSARLRLRSYTTARKYVNDGQRRFGDDPRYNLESVRQGFTSRATVCPDDRKLLERICSAYAKAVEAEREGPQVYKPTQWWQQVRLYSLRDVIHALESSDLLSLEKMYGDFFRDPCSRGLVGVPYGMEGVGALERIHELHLRHFLTRTLDDIDYWAEQTGRRLSTSTLAGPEIGNPFGVMVDGTLVRPGAPYHNYCAMRVRQELTSESGTVAEIGGGYGGMAYYLLRDAPRIRYIDFDVPESLAVTAYYLMKSYPLKRFLLYGEAESETALEDVDVALMPLSMLDKMKAKSVDITFSSHAISDMDRDALTAILRVVTKITRRTFLHIGKYEAAELIKELATQRLFRLKETNESKWHHSVSRGALESESVYDVTAAAE